MFLSLLFAALSWLPLFDKDEHGGGDGDGSPGDASPAPEGGNEPDDQDQDNDEDQVAMRRDRFNQRLRQERSAGVRELLGTLGFEDIDDPNSLQAAQDQLGDLIEFAREQRQANQTAVERLEGDLDTERERHQQTQQALSVVENQLAAFVRRDALLKHASDAVDPDDVVTWARDYRTDDFEAILVADETVFSEDGAFNSDAIDEDAVKRIIEDCKKEKKHYWSAAQQRQRGAGSPSNSDARDVGKDISQQRKLAQDIVSKTMGGGGRR